MFKLGLIINPFAGIGGRVGLKGSDGKKIRDKALALGAEKLAVYKTQNCFAQFEQYFSKIMVYTVSGEMGEGLCQQLAIPYEVVYQASQSSTANDTKNAVAKLLDKNLDLLLFAGGDGTARDIVQTYNDQQAVLGIPAGVKIHSGVYAISAEAAGLLVLELLEGNMLSLIDANVVDIDEQAFRQGRVKARRYGELKIPASLQYIQAVKNGGVEVESLVLDDIAADVIEQMDDDTYYVISSGTTCAIIMQQLGLTNSLLGADIVFKEELYASDVAEKQLLSLLGEGKKVAVIMTVIGGQGHILGRGNHQFSPQVIRKIGWENFIIIASKSKLNGLDGRPLLVDTGDVSLDHQLTGLKKVITGYHDQVLYPVK